MKTNQPAGVRHQRYDEAFKQEAVRLWLSSGRSAQTTAEELGLKADDLYRWKQAGQSPRSAGATGLPEGKDALQAEVVRLRGEVTRLTEQRDILKKAAGILCELPLRGMPGSKP
jgi:transposase